jgi:hypothetical protein
LSEGCDPPNGLCAHDALIVNAAMHTRPWTRVIGLALAAAVAAHQP